MAQARNELTQLLLQIQTAARTAPSPAAAKVIPFTTYDVARDARRQKNPTVNASPLAEKSHAGNPITKGPITSILDLRTIGYWLKLALGQPTTTGTTLKTHTFPINLSARPAALLELGHLDIAKFYRCLDAHVNKIGWDVMANDQNISLDILAGEEIDPLPTTAFDAAPTSVAAVRSTSALGTISDGTGATLGTVVGGKIDINNNLTGHETADGKPGYGLFELGELMFGGSLRCVFDGASAYDLARAGSSTRLKLVSSAVVGADTFALTADIPYVELVEKTPPRGGRSGLFADLTWSAHKGTTLPTVTLTNDVASY